MKTTFGIFCALLLLCTAPSRAASFDCGKASSPQERLICSNDELSVADDNLGSIFKAAIAVMDAGKKTNFVTQQRGWIKENAAACPVSGEKDRKASACLLERYRLRLSSLISMLREETLAKTPEVKNGPYSFKTPQFHLEFSGGQETLDISYVVMTAPENQTTEAWDKLNVVEERIFYAGCGGRGENYSKQELNLATDRFINLRRSDWSFCEGAAHGMGDDNVESFALQPAPHKLTVGDVFKANAAWQDTVATLCEKALKDDLFMRAPELVNALDISAVRTTSNSAENWSISPTGLVVHFPIYSVGPYVIGADDVEIGWDELKDFLALKLPVH